MAPRKTLGRRLERQVLRLACGGVLVAATFSRRGGGQKGRRLRHLLCGALDLHKVQGLQKVILTLKWFQRGAGQDCRQE